MSASATGKLDFILRLVDRVSQPLGKVKTSFSDMATRGQKSLIQMGVGMVGMISAAHALKAAMRKQGSDPEGSTIFLISRRSRDVGLCCF